MDTRQTYIIEGMDCAHCATELEIGVSRLPGVREVRVDFATAQMQVEGEVPLENLRERVAALGKTLVVPETSSTPPTVKPRRAGAAGFWDYLRARRETQFALLGGLAVIITWAATLFGLSAAIASPLYIAGMLLTLYPIARSGLTALWINRSFNINLLMTIAAVGAVVLGEYLEGATVIFLFAVGKPLEGYTADRARDSIRSLMGLKPTTATRVIGILEERVPVEQLAVGDVLLVKPGEQIPMDGDVLTGVSGVNQAPITGESLPITKQAGDEVYAGTINGAGALTLRVTRLAQDNTLSRIIQLVEQAQSARAHSQRMIDRFAQVYTPAVAGLALLIALLPPLLFKQPFYDTPGGHGWVHPALAMLVLACPCALVISTPVTVISAITAAARRGVLIKGGAHLEALGTVRAFAFDKTGTLTQGKPVVTQYRSAECATGSPACPDCDAVLALAAAVETRAAHPLARAVVSAANAHHLGYQPAEAVEMLPGAGVRGVVDGSVVTLGSHRLFEDAFPHPSQLCAWAHEAEAAGETTMLIAQGEQVRGFVALADSVRENSRSVVRQLGALGMTTIMLTGDHAAVAARVGEQVGVSDVRAGLLPGDKLTAVDGLVRQYGAVAMVGDGVNDTPALAAATVGIAMGGAGSPQALETADIALMADDLTQLPFAVRLARLARRLIWQNVLLSFSVKAVFLVLAFFGLTSLWVAILADVGMSLLVTLNGMRPLRLR